MQSKHENSYWIVSETKSYCTEKKQHFHLDLEILSKYTHASPFLLTEQVSWLTIENIQKIFKKQSLGDGIFGNVHKHTFCTFSILCAGLVQYMMRMNEQLLLYYKLTHI